MVFARTFLSTKTVGVAWHWLISDGSAYSRTVAAVCCDGFRVAVHANPAAAQVSTCSRPTAKVGDSR